MRSGTQKRQYIHSIQNRDGSASFGSGTGKVDRWLNDHEKLFIGILFFVIAGLLAISPFIPDNGHEIVQSELTKAGYNVEGIEFTLIEKDGFASSGKRLYQASEPIEYAAGIHVDHWELKSYSFSTFNTHYIVTPYPEIPIAVPVNLLLTITQEDYELLHERAGDQAIEEYVKQLINKDIKGAE